MCSSQLPLQYLKLTYRLCEECTRSQRDRTVDDRSHAVNEVNTVNGRCYQIKYYVLIHKCGPLASEGYRGSYLIQTEAIESVWTLIYSVKRRLICNWGSSQLILTLLEPITNSCPGQFCEYFVQWNVIRTIIFNALYIHKYWTKDEIYLHWPCSLSIERIAGA